MENLKIKKYIHSHRFQYSKFQCYWRVGIAFLNSFHPHQNVRVTKDEKINRNHTLLPFKSLRHENLRFHIFERQMPPLTKFEAKECLCDLLTQTAIALLELHTIGYAHLDVRLPNICLIILLTRPALEGGQGRPWPPQLFITPSAIEKIKPSEIIRVIIINYGGQLVLDGVSRSVSSSNKVTKRQIGSKTHYYQWSLFEKFKFLHYDVAG